jgi:hypothetical protein
VDDEVEGVDDEDEVAQRQKMNRKLQKLPKIKLHLEQL